MSEYTPQLPNGFLVESYRIVDLIDSGDDFYLYKAEAPDGSTVELREFCLRSLSVRDPESQRIRYRDPDPAYINTLKGKFDSLYSAASQREVSANGTSYLVYEKKTAPVIAARETANRRPGARPAAGAGTAAGAARQQRKPGYMPPPRMSAPKKSNGMAAVIVIMAVLFVGGFLCYQLWPQKEVPETVAVEKPKPKPKPKPVVVIEEPQPEPEPEPEPEPIVAVEEPEPEPEPEPVKEYAPSESLQEMKARLIANFDKNKGQITPDMWKAYVDYSEKAVREYVVEKGGKFSPAFDEWVKKTDHRGEIFASFYPPDPSVATNADILVNELGERAYKYDQMLVAFAVGRRKIGLGAFDLERQSKYPLAFNHIGNIPSWQDPCDLFIEGKKPINYFGPSPRSIDEAAYAKVHEYLVKTKQTPKQAWLKKKETLAALGDEGISSGDLMPLLQEELYRTGQMRRKRDPYPTSVQFFNYLVDKYENIDKMRDVSRKKVEWDGVPLDCTPWLAMLPLSESRPIRECEAVWDRYLGKMGGQRIIRYTHYRMDDDPEPPALFTLDPDPEWSLDSNDRCIYVGGVCGTMSMIARNSHIALGSPAGPAGQPGHGNLITFHYGGSGSWLTVDQSVDTLKNTTADWYLRDSDAPRTGNGEYHVGLAMSLNMDIDDVLNSRLSMNILKLVSDSGSDSAPSETSCARALMDILKLNPFYTEAWYKLFNARGGDLKSAMACIDEIREYIPEGSKANKLWERKKYNKNLGRPDKNFKDNLSARSKEYVDTLNASLIELGLKAGRFDFSQLEWGKVLAWMKKEAKSNSYEEVNQAYQIAIVQSKGTKNLLSDVNRDFDRVLKHYKSKSSAKKELKIDPDELALKINAITMAMPEKEALPWVTKFVEECPELLRYAPKQRGVRMTSFYKCVTDLYMKLADESVAQSFRDTLKRQEADAEALFHGSGPVGEG